MIPHRCSRPILLGRNAGLLCALALLTGCAGDTATPTRVPTPEVVETGFSAFDELIVSPDGRHIAFTVYEDLLRKVYIADIDGRNARRVRPGTRILVQRDLAFSPDGSVLAFIESDGPRTGDLYTVPVSGGEPLRLTHLSSQVNDLSFSPGGSRILFRSEHADVRGSFWTVPSAGGEIVQMETDPGIEILEARWLPDSTKILLEIRGDAPLSGIVAVLDVPTGRVDRITTEGHEYPWDWSPDGSEVVYESARTGQGDLWVAPIDGGPARQLTIDVRHEEEGTWSPDGRWIAYRSERGGQSDIWIVPAAGGDAVRVTNDDAREDRLVWTPDGDALMYVRSEEARHLYAVPAAGGTPRMLTPAEQRFFGFDVSPDGRFVAHVQDEAGLGEIWLTPVDGGESRALVGGSENDDPRWSPDGSRIAYVSRRGLRPSIWVVDVATGEERQVSPDGMRAWLIDWSADGEHILMHSPSEDGRPRIMSMPVAGGEPTAIADLDGFPVPSPDGERLAFTWTIGGGDNGVWVLPSAGGTATLLTGGQRLTPLPPIWSSDSRRIAYDVFSEDGGSVDVFVVNADGSDRRRLTSGPAYESASRWSADDAEIFFRSDADRFAAVDVATGEVRTLFDGGPAVGDVVAVTPDGETIVFSTITARSEIMRVDLRELLGR